MHKPAGNASPGSKLLKRAGQVVGSLLGLRFGAPLAARTQSAELDDQSDEARAQEVAAQAARDGGEPEEELDGGETVIAIAKTVKKTGKLEQEKPRKRLRLAEAELGTALDVKLAEWVRHLESRPRDPVNATSPLLQFERGLGATKEDAVAQIFLDPKLAKGKRPGESELGGRLCTALFDQHIISAPTTWGTLNKHLEALIKESSDWFKRPPSEVSDKERLVPSFVNVLLCPSKRGACLATLKPELLIDTAESRVCGQREEKNGYCVVRCD